jgi:hypothetical protein
MEEMEYRLLVPIRITRLDSMFELTNQFKHEA